MSMLVFFFSLSVFFECLDLSFFWFISMFSVYITLFFSLIVVVSGHSGLCTWQGLFSLIFIKGFAFGIDRIGLFSLFFCMHTLRLSLFLLSVSCIFFVHK